MKIEATEDQEVLKKEVPSDNTDAVDSLSREISSLNLKEDLSLCERGIHGNDFLLNTNKHRCASRQNNLPYNISPVNNNSFLNDCYDTIRNNILLGESLEESPSNISVPPVNNSQLLLTGGSPVLPYEEILQILKEPSEEETTEFVKSCLEYPLDTASEESVLNFVLEYDSKEENSRNSSRSSSLSDQSMPFSPGSMISSPSTSSQSSDTNESHDSCGSLVTKFNQNSFSFQSNNEGEEKTDSNRNTPPKNINRKFMPILPKIDLAAPPIAVSNVPAPRVNRKSQVGYYKNLKDQLLSEFKKEEKDKFHKQILSLQRKYGGLGGSNAAGQNYLHSYISKSGSDKQVIYFIHILGVWNGKNERLQGINVETLINAQDNDGRSPLYYCTIFKKDVVARILLECGADPNIPENTLGDTPLHCASQRGMSFLNMVDALSSFPKTELDKPNSLGETALHQAVKNHLKYHEDHNSNTSEIIHSKPIIERLLRAGAKLAVKDKYGKTPLHLAVQAGNKEILDWLHQYSTDFDKAINIRDNTGSTVLHIAVKLVLPSSLIREEIIRKLLIFGADGDIVDNEGKAPNAYANPRPPPNVERAV